MTMPSMILSGLLMVLAAVGCGAQDPAAAPPPPPTEVPTATPDGPEAVPAEFGPACGKPGTRVTTSTSTTIAREDCDLTGVTISSQDRGSAVVPPPGTGVSHSAGLTLSTNPDGDVSVYIGG